MYTIADLVKVDEHIAEQSVVQIDFYSEEERNLALLRDFVFAPSAPEGMVCHLAILHKLREASLTDAKENVFCIIANYGQGKSHFGLVLANFFGREVASKEFQEVMRRISHAEVDEVRVRNLREFREARKPYLVVRLRGDSPHPLDQQFLKGVQNALREAGINGKLPLWYEKAAEWLEVLPQKGLAAQANEFLRQHRLDLHGLIGLVRDYNEDTHELVNDLHKRLVGTVPHFEGDLEARDLLRWLVDHYCKQEQRFGGVLILFDEFSQFVERYYSGRKYAGSLQRLLETVDALRKQVLFVAFAQHDPVQMARDAMNPMSQAQRDEALRELQRLPEHNKLRLYTRMEQVIDGYLKQENGRFSQLLQEHRDVDDVLWEAGALTRKVLSMRYSEEHHWTAEEFHRVVCKGCFPLHPLTTALLAQGLHAFAVQVDTPRTVLGFVFDRVRRKLDEPALNSGNTPNWIYAVDLVDYFQEMLPQNQMYQYRNALQRIENTPTRDQVAVLKAVLLISLSDMTIRRDDFVEVVSHLSGVDPDTAAKTLKELAEVYALYEEHGRYRFFSLGGDLQRLQALKQAEWQKPISERDIHLLNQRFCISPEVDVPWGHKEDWAASQDIWLCRDFTAQKLGDYHLLERLRCLGTHKEVGWVIRLLALREEELESLEERVTEIMDQVFGDTNPPPVLVVLPSEPSPDVVRWVRWSEFLANMSPTDQREIGEELIRRERTVAEGEIETAKETLLTDKVDIQGHNGQRIVVPKAYRVVVKETNPKSLREVLLQLYRRAYPFVPPFFDQYSQNSAKLRADIKRLCIALTEDNVGAVVDTLGKGPGRDCVHKYLQDRWQVLDSDYRIKCPTPNSNSVIRHAWQELDKAFSSKEAPVGVAEVLIRLMKPPYGYQVHQLSLLLSAWYGYNRKRVELSINGRLDTLKSFWVQPGVERPDKLIGALFKAGVTIRQVDTQKEKGQIELLVEVILSRNKEFSQQDAELALSKLKEAGARLDSLDEKLKEEINRACEELEKSLRAAQAYDRRATQLLKMAESGEQVRTLAEAYANPDLPEIGVVAPSQPSREELQRRILARIRQRVEGLCREAESLNQLEDVNKYKEQLKRVQHAVKLTRNQELEKRVADALERVEERGEELRREIREREIIIEMQAMAANAPLYDLRKYMERLKGLKPVSTKAQQIHEEKVAEIGGAIRQSQERAQRWEESWRQAVDKASLEQLRGDVQRNWRHYEGTPELKHLEVVENGCKHVLSIVEKIERLGHSFPANLEDVKEIKKQFEEIGSESEHPAVRMAVERAVRALEDYVEKKKDEASNWLRQREQEAQQANGDDLYRVLQRLSSPPAFLRDSDKAELEHLRTMVQQRFEDDMEAAIRARLRQIRNVDKLRRLREEIDKLLSELGNGRA